MPRDTKTESTKRETTKTEATTDQRSRAVLAAKDPPAQATFADYTNASKALLFVRSVDAPGGSSVKIRRLSDEGQPSFLAVIAGYVLRPTDLLMVEGNASCEIWFLKGEPAPDLSAQQAPANAIPIVLVESRRLKPGRASWLGNTDPGPSAQDYRFLTFRSPPIVEVRQQRSGEGHLIHEVFVENGVVQIWDGPAPVAQSCC